MHQIDADAVKLYGVPEIALMENAGRETAYEAAKLCGGAAAGR